MNCKEEQTILYKLCPINSLYFPLAIISNTHTYPLTVTLSGSGGEEFRGFLVQARTVADDSPVGTFIDNGDDQALSSCTPPEVVYSPITERLGD